MITYLRLSAIFAIVNIITGYIMKYKYKDYDDIGDVKLCMSLITFSLLPLIRWVFFVVSCFVMNDYFRGR